MRKPTILTTDKADYKFLLKFSDLVKLRDEYDIDLIAGTDKIINDFAEARKVFKVGISSGEKRELSEEETIEAFDEIMDSYGFLEVLEVIEKSMAIKTVKVDEVESFKDALVEDEKK